jgi:hypothetical protein
MGKYFKYVFIALILAIILEEELVQTRYSSPAPDPGLGRTVAVSGTNGRTVYVTPLISRLTWTLFAACAATFIFSIFWPPEKPATVVRATHPVSRSITVGKLVYDWSPRKLSIWKKYGFTVIAFGIAIYAWIRERGSFGWVPGTVFSLVALWSLGSLVDYRTSIDVEAGVFEREKLFLGRHRIGALKLSLNEFSSVVLDHYDRSEDNTVMFSVCLKHRSGQLKQICYFEVPRDQRSEPAEKTARELAEATGLPYEEVIR